MVCRCRKEATYTMEYCQSSVQENYFTYPSCPDRYSVVKYEFIFWEDPLTSETGVQCYMWYSYQHHPGYSAAQVPGVCCAGWVNFRVMGWCFRIKTSVYGWCGCKSGVKLAVEDFISQLFYNYGPLIPISKSLDPLRKRFSNYERLHLVYW